jgi:hypothetical protein
MPPRRWPAVLAPDYLREHLKIRLLPPELDPSPCPSRAHRLVAGCLEVGVNQCCVRS